MDCPNDRYLTDTAFWQAVIRIPAHNGVKIALLAQPKEQYFGRV